MSFRATGGVRNPFAKDYYFPEGEIFGLEGPWEWIGAALPEWPREILWDIVSNPDPVQPSPPVISQIPTPPIQRPAPASDEDSDMAIDWGGIIGSVVSEAATGYFNPQPQLFAGPAALLPVGPPIQTGFAGPVQRPATTAAVMENVCGLDGQNWSGQAPPKGYKVVNYCGQAVLRKIRRRRRRRMLSVSDKNDIASIISMAGKGQLAASLINRTSP